VAGVTQLVVITAAIIAISFAAAAIAWAAVMLALIRRIPDVDARRKSPARQTAPRPGETPSA
jgi:hypothetical protein